MEFDVLTVAPPLRQARALAREAEDLGCSGMWFGETGNNPYLGIAAAAEETEQLEFGTAIAVAFPRSPMVTAQVAWDLADATRGKFILGLGTQVKGHMERRFSVPFTQPGAKLREYVLALRAIFRAFQGEEPLKFEGDFYSFSLLTDFFSPGAIEFPRVPIYIAGVNTGLATIAGQVCDGFHVHPLHSRSYLEEVMRPAVAVGAKRAHRPADEVVLAVPVMTIVGDTDEEVDQQREAVRQQLAFYGSTPTYRAVFEHHAWDDVPDRLRSLQKQGQVDEMAGVITDEMLEAYAVTATWDSLAPALLARLAGVAQRVSCYHAAGDWRRSPERAERWRAVAAAVRSG